MTNRQITLLSFICLSLLLIGKAGVARGDNSNLPAPKFRNPQPVVIRGLPDGAGGTPISTEEPFISRDGRFLFFNSGKEENNKDLHYAEFTAGVWFYGGEIGPGINTIKEVQGNPTMDREGRFYYIDSAASPMVRVGNFSLNGGALQGVTDFYGVPDRKMVVVKRQFFGNMGVEVSADGDTLFFSRATWMMKGFALDGLTEADIFFTKKEGGRFVFRPGEVREIMKHINSGDLDYAASLSADGLELFFTRLPLAALKARKVRSMIMRATRTAVTEPFDMPKTVEAIGSTHFVEGPAISPDGAELYYHRREGEKFRLYKVTRAR